MSKLIPDYVFDSIYDITPEVLTAHGVRGVLACAVATEHVGENLVADDGNLAHGQAKPVCRLAKAAGERLSGMADIAHTERLGQLGVVCRRRLQEKRGCACMARTDGTDRV